MVISRFSISTFLIIGAATVREQLDYIGTKDLGFDRHVVLNVHAFRLDYDLIQKYQDVKKAFSQHPGVFSASASLTRIGKNAGRSRVQLEGFGPVLEDRMSIDEDYVDLYGLTIKMGGNISDRANGGGDVGFFTGAEVAATAEVGVEVLVNESAVEQFGWEDPIGNSSTCRLGTEPEEPW